jgi:hypothetical protein
MATTRTIIDMGMSHADARAYAHAVAPIAGSKACQSWKFRTTNGTERPKDPGGTPG